MPRTGGAVLLSNHQSNLDPVIAGLAADRRLNYLARDTLFKFPPFRWLILSLDAIPIYRDGSGISGLKETLRRLRQGEIVLIFPEGTRTSDGEVAPLLPGFCALARRGRVPLVPMAIDGAFEAWPRWRLLPRPAVIHVQLGPPLSADEAAGMSDAELVAELARRIGDCHRKARGFRLRAVGRGGGSGCQQEEVSRKGEKLQRWPGGVLGGGGGFGLQ